MIRLFIPYTEPRDGYQTGDGGNNQGTRQIETEHLLAQKEGTTYNGHKYGGDQRNYILFLLAHQIDGDGP